jgi:hypothetical protein
MIEIQARTGAASQPTKAQLFQDAIARDNDEFIGRQEQSQDVRTYVIQSTLIAFQNATSLLFSFLFPLPQLTFFCSLVLINSFAYV